MSVDTALCSVLIRLRFAMISGDRHSQREFGLPTSCECALLG